VRTKSKTKAVIAILVFSLIASCTGCTKEKAEAIKTRAEQFRVEAKAAIDQIRALDKQDAQVLFTSSVQEAKSIANDFELLPAATTPAQISQTVSGKISVKARTSSSNAPVEEKLSRIEEAYELFGSMFRSLPRGNFLAKNAVKKSKIFAIKLTIEMVHLAAYLDANPFEFRGRRLDLANQFMAARQLTDPTEKKQALLLASQELIKLRDDEAKSNADAETQCLKAAEAGKLITDLIDKYEILTVGDIIDLTRNSLSIINDVTGGNHDVQGALTRYNVFVTNKIDTDPLWKDVLKTDVKSLESLGDSSKH
jgi:hypothetical protein